MWLKHSPRLTHTHTPHSYYCYSAKALCVLCSGLQKKQYCIVPKSIAHLQNIFCSLTSKITNLHLIHTGLVFILLLQLWYILDNHCSNWMPRLVIFLIMFCNYCLTPHMHLVSNVFPWQTFFSIWFKLLFANSVRSVYVLQVVHIFLMSWEIRVSHTLSVSFSCPAQSLSCILVCSAGLLKWMVLQCQPVHFSSCGALLLLRWRCTKTATILQTFISVT